MREYIFRGYDAVGDKGWVFGDLVHNKKVTREGLEDRVMVGGYEVVPESVGLFIGCKDRNGNEIFEGDILCISDNKNHIAVVEFDTNYMRFICIGIGNRLGYIFFNNSSLKTEVVGNKFENKDMIK